MRYKNSYNLEEFISEVLNTPNVKILINIPLVGKKEIEAVTSVLKEGALTTAVKTGGKMFKNLKN